MTQEVFSDIDPNVTSGTELATFLNDFKASLLSVNSGPTAPTYAVVGTPWLDDSVATKLTMKNYDGAQWISEFTIDTVAHTISFGGNNPTASFTASRTDTAADMIEMFRDTAAQTDGALIFTQNNDSAIKKTMAKFKAISESVSNGAEEGSFALQAMVAGTLTDLFTVKFDELFFEALKGTGERVLKVDANGLVTADKVSGDANIFENGAASNADIGSYTINAPLTLALSSISTELIDSSSVFKSISTSAAETFETEVIALSNGHIESPMIVGFKFKSGADWTCEIVDNDSTLTLETSTIEAYVPTVNEASLHKMFVVIPAATANIKLRFTSTAADTLLFDDIKIYSWINQDEPLYFSKDIANLQTNTDLFTIANRKNAVLKVEGQITRETDTGYADAIYSCFISNNGTINRVVGETVTDMETDEAATFLDMNGNILIYSSNDLTGANYTGKFKGRITRVL